MGISDRLQEERKRLGLTQEAAAEKLGATKRSVINWEGGASLPGAEVLAGYAAAGADVLYILTGIHTPDVPVLDPMEQLLVNNYRECAAEDKAALIKDSTLYAAHVKKSSETQAVKIVKATVKKSLFGGAIGSIRVGK